MNKHSQLAKWFRTLLFVLIPTFAICSLLCAYLLVTFEKSIIKNNTELTLSSQKLVDERLRECVYLSSYLSMSAENDELSYKEGAYRKNPAEAYDLSAQLHELVISNEAVSGLFIYYPQSDYIVSNIGCYTSSSYYVLQKFPIRDNYEKWIIDLLSCESNSLISLDFPGGARLCYCRTYTRDAKTVSIIVIQLNPEMISELINSAIYHPDSSAAIISDGAIVLSTGNEDLLSSNLHLSSAPHSSAKINSHFIFKNTSDVLSNVDLVHIYSSNSLLIKFRNVTVVCVVRS